MCTYFQATDNKKTIINFLYFQSYVTICKYSPFKVTCSDKCMVKS